MSKINLENNILINYIKDDEKFNIELRAVFNRYFKENFDKLIKIYNKETSNDTFWNTLEKMIERDTILFIAHKLSVFLKTIYKEIPVFPEDFLNNLFVYTVETMKDNLFGELTRDGISEILEPQFICRKRELIDKKIIDSDGELIEQPHKLNC